MPEAATEEDIRRAVAECIADYTVVSESRSTSGNLITEGPYSAIGYDALDMFPAEIHAVRGRQQGEGMTVAVVDQSRLIKALLNMRFQRSTMADEVAVLLRPAMRLRHEIQAQKDQAWKGLGYTEQLTVLDAYIAGLSLAQCPNMSMKIGTVADRMSKERDPDWEAYRKLHAKFEGVRP